MIVSASYKTDIPAFYGRWFLNRLRAGYCKMVNPYGGQVYTVDLTRPVVDGFVFWSRNVGPFLPVLAEVRQRGYPFVVQLGITGYPRQLEHAVIPASKSIEHAHRIAEEFGPRVVVWRYDTIIHSSLTDRDFHLRNFEKLANALQGTTDEVVISFAQTYRKTLRNMNSAAAEFGFSWQDPPAEEKLDLARQLAQIARSHAMQLTVCSQRDYVVEGAADARCIDARRLSDIAGAAINVPLKGNRKECGCNQSRDIGAYDTCPHGCVYCYAVSSQARAKQRLCQHDPNGEFLVPP
jgi:hypothetical protein